MGRYGSTSFEGPVEYYNGAGHRVSGIGDINGDGFEDYAISARYGRDEYFNRTGTVYVVFGEGEPPLSQDLGNLDGTNGFVLEREADSSFYYGTNFGSSITGLGDVNGDGVDDFAVAQNGTRFVYGDGENYYYGRPADGVAYVIYGGQFDDMSESVSVTSLDHTRLTTDGEITEVVNLGDVNGDSFDDVGLNVHRRSDSSGPVDVVYFHDQNDNGTYDDGEYAYSGQRYVGVSEVTGYVIYGSDTPEQVIDTNALAGDGTDGFSVAAGDVLRDNNFFGVEFAELAFSSGGVGVNDTYSDYFVGLVGAVDVDGDGFADVFVARGGVQVETEYFFRSAYGYGYYNRDYNSGSFPFSFAGGVIDGSGVGGSDVEGIDGNINGAYLIEQGNSAVLGDFSGDDGYGEFAYLDFQSSTSLSELADAGISNVTGVLVLNGNENRFDSTDFGSDADIGTTASFFYSSLTYENGRTSFFPDAVLGVGDVTGDGIDDMMIIGRDFSNTTGAITAYIVGGTQTDRVGVFDLDELVAAGSAYRIIGDEGSGFEPLWFAPAGDVNNDGADDIIIGARQDNNGNGGAEIFYGGEHLEAIDQADGTDDNVALAANGEVDVDTGLLPIRIELTDNRFLNEGTGAPTDFEFTVRRTGNLLAEVSVDWVVQGGGFSAFATDADANDFVGGAFPSGVLTFAAGEATAKIVVQVAGDAVTENAEDFIVLISNPTTDNGAPISIESNRGIGYIYNDDFPVQFRIYDVNVVEGDTGETTTVNVRITRTGLTDVEASVDYSIQPYVSSQAANSDDVVGTLPFIGTVTFASGETEKFVTFEVQGDDVVESSEYLQAILSNPTAAGGAEVEITDASAFIQIINDDEPMRFRSSNVFVTEGVNSEMTFTVTRSGKTDIAGTVDYSLGRYIDLNQSAEAADFGATFPASGTVSFAAGETSKTVSLPIVDDTIYEGTEYVELRLSNPQSAAAEGNFVDTPTVYGYLFDNEVPVYYRVNNGYVTEGDEGETTTMLVNVTRSGDTGSAGSVNYEVAAYRYGSSANDDDFVGTLPITGVVNFAAGETSKQIEIEIAGDNLYENTEYFEVRISNPLSADPTAQTVISRGLAYGYIYDDDSPVFFRAYGSSVLEGDPGDTRVLDFTVTRYGDTSVEASVKYDIAGGTVDSADFDSTFPTSGILTFAANETVKTVRIQISEDNDIENDEYTYLTLSDPSSPPGTDAFVSGGAAVGTIRTDDFPAIISTSYSASVTEGDPGDARTLTFQVFRSGDTTSTVTMDWNFAGSGYNQLNSADFEAGLPQNGNLTFNPGQTVKEVSFAVLEDDTIESNESGTFTISNVTSSSGEVQVNRSAAYGTVINDDFAPRILTYINGSLYGASVNEGNSGFTPITVTFERDGDATGELTITYSLETNQGSVFAADSQDIEGFLPAPGLKVEFADGQFSKTVTINVNGDGLIEANESFNLRITNVESSEGIDYSVFNANSFITIRNDDGRPPIPQLPFDVDGDGVIEEGEFIQVEADVFGDPHITTLDGLGYDFQAVGEYVLVETLDGATNPFSVQVRFEAFPGSDLVSVTTRMAVEIKGHTVEIDALNSGAPLLIDGVPADPDDLSIGAIDLDGDADNGYDIYIDDEGKISIILNEAGEQLMVGLLDGALNVCVFLADPAVGGNSGAVRGLMGNANQDLSDDFGLRDGSAIPEEVLTFDGDTPQLTFDYIYGRGEWEGNGYRDSWALADGESLFSGDTPDYPENFPAGPLSVENLPADVRAAAEQAARDAGLDPLDDEVIFNNAVLDFALTGNEGFLLGATQLAAETEDSSEATEAPELTQTVSVSAKQKSVVEGDTGVREVEFTFYRTGSAEELGGSLDVSYKIAGGVNADDLGTGTPLNGTIAFASGETEQTLVVLVKGDLTTEANEALNVVITGTSSDGVLVAGSQGSTTIVTDDFGPQAQDDLFAEKAGATVSGNVFANNTNGADTDADDDTLMVTKIIAGGVEYTPGDSPITLPDGVILTISADGDFEADTTARSVLSVGQIGETVFDYEVSDGNGGTDTAQVKITLRGTSTANRAPVANDDSYSVKANTPLTVDALAGVLANDSDPDGDPISVVSFFNTSNGTLNMATDGSFTYTPDAGFVGQEVVSYTVFDGVESVQATLTIDVQGDDLIELTGTSGRDLLRGTDADERIDGLAGSDTHYGGGGSDTFVFTSDGVRDRESIRDFEAGVDSILLDSDYSVRFTSRYALITTDEDQIFVYGNAVTEADLNITMDDTVLT